MQTLQHIQTPSLNIGYEEHGADNQPAVLLLHGWPDDVRTWDGVLPELVQAGCRTLAPYLRGFGSTRFRDAGTRRSGQVTALAQDVLDFADAIGLNTFTL